MLCIKSSRQAEKRSRDKSRENATIQEENGPLTTRIEKMRTHLNLMTEIPKRKEVQPNLE